MKDLKIFMHEKDKFNEIVLKLDMKKWIQQNCNCKTHDCKYVIYSNEYFTYVSDLIESYWDEINKGDYNNVYFYLVKWFYNKHIGGHFFIDGNKRTFRFVMEELNKIVSEGSLK